MKPILFAAAALIAGCIALPALADDASVAPQAAVTTAGVDFRDPVAVRAFYGRLAMAAERVCDSNSANSRVQQLDRACVQKAVAEAVRSADRPMLTALYSTSQEAHASR